MPFHPHQPPGQTPDGHRPAQVTPKLKRRTGTWVLALVTTVVVLGACSDEAESSQDEATAAASAVAPSQAEPTTGTEPTPIPTPEPEPTTEASVVAYGSDPSLDALHDACEAGDIEACNELFVQSPQSSEYETFAQARDGFFPGAAEESTEGLTEREVFLTRAMELVWKEYPSADRDALCAEFAATPDAQYEKFVQDAGEDISRLWFDNFLIWVC